MATADDHDRDFGEQYWRQAPPAPANLGTLTPDAVDDRAFRMLADNAPALCWIANADGYIVWYNRRWHEYCGTTPEQMEGWGWTAVHDPQVLPAVLEQWTAAIANSEPFEMTFPLLGADGRYRPFLTRIQPVRSTAGDVIRWFGVNTDVSKQIESERALHESELRFRTVTEAMPGYVWTADETGIPNYASPRWQRYCGADASMSYVEGWTQFVHPEDQPDAAVRWADAVAGNRSYEVEYRLRRADGEYRWWLVRALPVSDATNRSTRWVGVCLEVHETVAARQMLAESHDELERRVQARTRERDRAWKNSRDLQAVCDARGVYLAANDAWSRILGWQPGEIIGSCVMDLLHPDDRQTSERALEAARGGVLDAFENRQRHKDGSYRWISWAAAAEDGLVYASGRHVTAEKEAQAALAAAQEQLRQSQKLEAVGQLTGGVAHDFNNLLTIIRSCTGFLKRPGLAEERRARYVNAISDTVDRASHLTNQLLAFARRQELRPEVFDVNGRVEKIVELMRPLLGSGIVIDTRLHGQPCWVEADVSQFETSLVNLAINARDAMSGTGRLRFEVMREKRPPPLPGRGSPGGSFVSIAVVDEGTGIPPEHIDNIFEPFFTTKEVGKGTGLGLSQVFGFAKQSGGEVTVRSEPGRGAAFLVHLPEVPAPTTAVSGTSTERPAPAAERLRVLLVEDNEAVGAIAAELLDELGYATILTPNAEKALAILDGAEPRFDAVVTDVVMPGMNGLQLALRLRATHPGLPVILTSGYSNALVDEGRQGCEFFLRKPYSAEDLSRALATALRFKG